MRIATALLIALICFTLVLQADVVTFQEGDAAYAGTGDSYIDIAAPTTNSDAAGYLKLYDFEDTWSTCKYVTRAVLSFDLSSLPVDTVVDTAELSLYVETLTVGDPGQEFMFHPLLTSYVEEEVTWNINMTDSSWGTGGGDYDLQAFGRTPLFLVTAGAWITVDLTPLVQRWIENPASNNGLLIRWDHELHSGSAGYINDMTFTDSEGVVAANRPGMEITHSVNPYDGDGDELQDSWEIFYFDNTGAKDGTVDSDLDGYTDLEEFSAGTDPTASISSPAPVSSGADASAGCMPGSSVGMLFWALISLVLIYRKR